MPTDTLALLEFFVETICKEAERAPTVHNTRNLDNDTSYFSPINDCTLQCTSMHDLLNGHDTLLKSLAEKWKNEGDKPKEMLVQIEDFIIENKAYFERSKIEVRTILDYVYTIV